MKKLGILLLALLFSQFTFAQDQGIVIYEETRSLKIDLPPEFADMVPKERSQKKQLLFTNSKSIYKNVEKKSNVADEIASSQGNFHVQFKFSSGDPAFYRDNESRMFIEKQELFGRTFRILGKMEKVKWKVSADQKNIAGYMCIKATHMKNDTVPITAWFTPQIPIQNGPGAYGDLPGLILAVDVDNGKHVTRALNVDLRSLTDEEIIKAPTKGKEISREKFEKLRKEKIEEMKEMGGGNRIMIRHD